MQRFFRRLTLAVSMALLVAASGGSAFAAPSPGAEARFPGQLTLDDIARLSADATRRSIIIFRNQHGELPARGSTAGARARTIESDQAAVRNELAQLHARNVRGFHLVNALSATVSSAEADRLSLNPAVQAVVPDLPIPAPAAQLATDEPAATSGAAPGAAELQQLCPADPGVPLVEPEALQLMNAELQPGSGRLAAHDLATGAGVRVAFIADGVDPNNPDFQRDGKSIFFDYADFSAEGANAPTNGREAFGDAGSIAAQGNQVYDLSTFVNPAHPLPPGCNIRIKGVAPGAQLVGLKVFGNQTVAFASAFVQAIEYAVQVDDVDIINESFGANVYPDTNNDPVSLADAAAVQAGVTVTASSGDAGLSSTIGRPASEPSVINVAGTTQLRLYRQTTSFGSQLAAGGWISNNISSLSSGGFTHFGPDTVDVSAPGDLGWSQCTPVPAVYLGCTNRGQPASIQQFGGTSESAPLTAGAAALVIEAYERTHGGIRPTPELVKQILVGSATDLHVPAYQQGAGLVNALKAVQTALSIHDGNGAPAPHGQGLVVSPTRLSATGPAGANRSFRVTITNAGADARTVTPSLLALDDAPASSDTGTLTLAAATAPTFIDGGGTPSAYLLHEFEVPDGAQRLDGNIAWNGQAFPNARVRETLFDPFGRLAAYSLPQGPGGFGHVDVHDPAPGTWTALLWTQKNATAYNGDFQFAFTTQRFVPTGAVSPASRTLAPGVSGTFDVRLRLPVQPGDISARLVLNTGSDDDGSLPVTLRSLVPVGPAGGSFQGVLTGGNGRPIFGGDALTYQFDIPAGRAVLNLAVQLRDPNYNLTGFLVDPSGEPVDTQSTGLAVAGGTTFTNAMQFFVRSPVAGRWTAIMVLNTPIDGARVQEPFTGTIGFAGTAVEASGLPSSPSTVLPAGQPVTATVQVSNGGVSRKDFFADARLTDVGAVPLLGLTPTTIQLPIKAGQAQPNFLVPTDTRELTIAANATSPITMHVSHRFGSPQLLATSLGASAIATHAAREVAPGTWAALPVQVGPFGNAASTPTTVAIGAAAQTRLFDTAVSASSGDLWLTSFVASAPYTPLTLAPGQAGAITLTITPNAPRGTVVRGIIEIDTFNPITVQGDEIVAIPYAYRVG